MSNDMTEKACKGTFTAIDPLAKQGHLKIIKDVLETGGVRPASPDDEIIMMNASDKAISDLSKQIKRH